MHVTSLPDYSLYQQHGHTGQTSSKITISVYSKTAFNP